MIQLIFWNSLWEVQSWSSKDLVYWGGQSVKSKQWIYEPRKILHRRSKSNCQRDKPSENLEQNQRQVGVYKPWDYRASSKWDRHGKVEQNPKKPMAAMIEQWQNQGCSLANGLSKETEGRNCFSLKSKAETASPWKGSGKITRCRQRGGFQCQLVVTIVSKPKTCGHRKEW